MARGQPEFRIDIDLSHAERAAQRIGTLLAALRQRHDLSRYEYTQFVQIVPGGPTHSHPILTLGTRFAESEDHLLSTYLHEQMHWYLWRLGGPDFDPVAPFFDELVRRYPKAPTSLPDGARNYEQTYIHLVVCWLEMTAMTELVGVKRAQALCNTNWGYRWIYRTVRRDNEALGKLLRAHGLWPMRTPVELDAQDRTRKRRALSASQQKTPKAAPPPRSLQSRRRPPVRGGRSAG